ncbi:hypothetical protein AUK11_01580 [bacterium CG2_30_37_16]|nr:MAG: hypothetical protein AUK11_01580 [bacterium CG2_30_37_16]PIP30475.1 MAG: hypothetical protein COX25_04535 [bacterium (Candidatus Howlettbacteria) CG23_combo_of_CG06-09_8_20_14_all_37_9]PIY00284.1 MAG: hypothetical protein COZ22_00590 [bacterium (Candidatus Howlettbacteria) CG_4_10_14_3_um_filter_37_10]PJB05645.1 MAG: hypothetical protein CO123_03720 [bacterium (Candidatus Howlettbacteria) CG_4_9_14_3_um_filter_37_10]
MKVKPDSSAYFNEAYNVLLGFSICLNEGMSDRHNGMQPIYLERFILFCEVVSNRFWELPSHSNIFPESFELRIKQALFRLRLNKDKPSTILTTYLLF